MATAGSVRNAISEAGVGRPQSRLIWVDAAKGLGIVLVVTGHALGGMIDAGQVPEPDWFRLLFLVIYTVHMPLFFMLSGLFVQGRIARAPGAFLPGVLRTILWPYALWSVVQLTVIWGAGALVNAPLADYGRNLLLLPLVPVAQFWFLYALLLLHVLGLAVLPRLGPAGLALIGFGLASLAARGVLPPILTDTASMAPYYAVGVWIGAVGGVGMRPGAGPVAALGAVALLAVGLATSLTLTELGPALASLKATDIAHIAFAFPSIFAALPASLALCALMAAAGDRLSGVLPYLGRHSLSIYVLHVMFVAGSRILLLKGFHLTGAVAVLPVLVVVGLAGPLLVYEGTRRWRLAGPLGLT